MLEELFGEPMWSPRRRAAR